jgi:UDP-2,3-diacylglucosamine pyrophosphatase LpxH
MPDRFFFNRLSNDEFENNSILDISNGGKVLIISDLHMGTGTRDDLSYNGEMLICILEEYYLKNGWYLVLNGDIEELQRYSFDQIKERWAGLYRVFSLFARENRLYRVIGNHDEKLIFLRNTSYPYFIHTAIKIVTSIIPAYVYHGHQLSAIYNRFNIFLGLLVRFFLKPFGIKNITDSRSPFKRFQIEKKAYSFSMKNNCLSIIGHTHRALFESLGRFDYIKFEIERLCRDYPASVGENRRRIEDEVTSLREELHKLKRQERRDVLRQSLYGDELPVPCLFNSGCALGKKGLTAIEMTNEDIALVYWFAEGKSRKFVTRGGYEIVNIPEKPYRRAVLNNDKLENIFARMKLLGHH